MLLLTGCVVQPNEDVRDFGAIARITGYAGQCEYIYRGICVESSDFLPKSDIDFALDFIANREGYSYRPFMVSPLGEAGFIVYTGEFQTESGAVQEIEFERMSDGTFNVLDRLTRLYDPPG